MKVETGIKIDLKLILINKHKSPIRPRNWLLFLYFVMWRYLKMIYLITWYLIGCIGFIWIVRKMSGRTTRRDLLIGLTIGGIGGVITVLVGLCHLIDSDWIDKDVF